MADRVVELTLPSELVDDIESRYAVRFGGFNQFVIFVLRELTKADATQADQEDQRMIEQRLKDLGYI